MQAYAYATIAFLMIVVAIFAIPESKVARLKTHGCGAGFRTTKFKIKCSVAKRMTPMTESFVHLTLTTVMSGHRYGLTGSPIGCRVEGFQGLVR